MKDIRDTPQAQPSIQSESTRTSTTGVHRASNPSSRRKWYRLYYFLAAFDLFTVALSLALNHQTRDIFARSIEVNQVWGQRLAEYSELGELAADVNAPGNDVFDSLDPAAESARMRAARAAFNERFAALREEVRVNADSADAGRVLDDFDAVAVGMDEMTGEAELIFSYFTQGQPDEAARRMATMDRKYGALNSALADLRREVAAIQQENLAQQAATADFLSKFEFVIAVAIVLMIGRAVVYGHNLFKQMDTDARERERYVADLRDAEARTRRLAAIVESSEDAIISSTLDGKITTWNAGAERLYGYTAEEAVGKPVSFLYPPEEPDELPGMLERLRRGESIEQYETQRVRKDGTRVDVSMSVFPVRDAKGSILGTAGILRDITDRKRAEEQQRRLVHEQAARAEAEAAAERIRRLQSLTDAALAHLTLDDLMRVLMGRVRELLAADTAAVLLLEGDNLVVRAGAGLEEMHRGMRFPVAEGFCGRVVAERRAMGLENLEQEEILNRVLREKGVTSLLGAPLVVEGRVLGALHVGTVARRRFGDEDTQLLQLAADRVALAIDNARLYQTERERAARLGLLAETGKDLLTTRTLGVLLRIALQRALAIGGYEQGRVLLLPENDGRLETQAALRADGSPLRNGESARSDDTCHRAVEERRALALDENGEEIELALHEGTTAPLAVLFLPLVTSEGRAIGVFALERTGQGRPLSGTDLDELQVLAAQLAGVVESAQLHTRLQRHLDALLALHGAGRALTASLDPETVGARLLDVVRQVCPAEAGVLRLRGERGQFRVQRTLGSEPLRRRAARAQGARAARAGALLDGAPHTFQLKPTAQGRRATGVAGWCVPLRVRQRVLGVLEVYGCGLDGEATGEILGNLATLGASALENARLYGALAEREQQLQDLVGRLLVAQEEERRRVAYNLHDGLAQTAAGTHLHLRAFARRFQSQVPEAREDLERALDLAQRTVREARGVVAELRPTALDDLGLEEALRLEVDDLRREGWQVDLEADLGPDRLDPATETALFRVTQEALRNARKHAQTDRARVLLQRTRRSVRLEVRDWGRGFRPEAAQAGGGPGERVGLSGMRERVALLGGRCEVRSRPGSGTRVVAEVPLAAPASPVPALAASSPLIDD